MTIDDPSNLSNTQWVGSIAYHSIGTSTLHRTLHTTLKRNYLGITLFVPLFHLRKDAAWPGLLDAMKDVATQHGAETTLSQVAIAWCIAKGTTPIPGVRNVRQAQDCRCGRQWPVVNVELGDGW